MTPPFLSLVVAGRNDDPNGGLTGDFLRALRYNYDQLVKAGVDTEIILVEWRPVPDRPWFATVVAEAFPDLAGRSLFSFVIDAEYHTALGLDNGLEFRDCLARNVGIRRARAPFVLSTSGGVVLGRDVVEFLRRRRLEPRTLYRATRIDVNSETESGEDASWFEDPRRHGAGYPIRPPYFANAAGDFQLMGAGTYAQIRGFNEVFRRAGIHVAANLCYKARSLGMEIVDTGGVVYRLGAGRVSEPDRQIAGDPATAPWDERHKTVVYENPETWGLHDAPARQMSAQTTVLEFDWSAVPPLVDFRRLVLPAFRHASLSEPAQ